MTWDKASSLSPGTAASVVPEMKYLPQCPAISPGWGGLRCVLEEGHKVPLGKGPPPGRQQIDHNFGGIGPYTPAYEGPPVNVPYAFYGDEQPAPVANDFPPVWGMVMKDMVDRDDLGRERYQTALQPYNGRDALRDAYEEALDLVVYLRQAIYERDNPPSCLGCGHLWSMHKDDKCTWVHGWTFVPCPCGESIPK